MTLRYSDKRRKSVDSIFIDTDDTSPLRPEQKAKSQFSLFLGDQSNQNPLTTVLCRPQDASVSTKEKLTHKYIQKTSNQNKSGKLSKTSDITSANGCVVDKGKNQHLMPGTFPNLSLIKSSSSSDIRHLQDFYDIKDTNDMRQIDEVDGPGSTKGAPVKWNNAHIDTQSTEMMLRTLDEFIKEKREKISQEESQKGEIVGKLISNFNLNPNDKSSKKMRRDFESKNKSAEKSIEKNKMDLKQLEYKRTIVCQDGIPWGVSPSDFVKSINIKERNKKITEIPKSISRHPEGYGHKSVSAENIIDLINDKSPETYSEFPWDNQSDSANYNRKCRTAENINKGFLNTSWTNFKKKDLVGNNSLYDGSQSKMSESNSVSSGLGREFLPVSTVNYGNPRHKSFSFSPPEDANKSNELFTIRMQSMYEDLDLLKKEVEDIRVDCSRVQYETVNLKLDMTTNSEVNSQKMVNTLERVDNLEHILDKLRGQCQLEFLTWKEDIRKTAEKLEYRLMTTRRDLQDSIDVCTNSIGLVEKRTEQLPFMSNRSGRADIRVIRDHFTNLLITLAAFIMILLSSAIQVLIRGFNLGASASQHKVSFLLMVAALLAIIIGIVTWSVFLAPPVLSNA